LVNIKIKICCSIVWLYKIFFFNHCVVGFVRTVFRQYTKNLCLLPHNICRFVSNLQITHHMPYAVKRLHFTEFESRPGQDVFPYSQKLHTGCASPNGYWGCFSGVSWPRPDVGHLSPPTVNVNDLSHISPPTTHLRGVVRDSFALCTFIFRKIVLRCLSVASGNLLMVLGAECEFVARK